MRYKVIFIDIDDTLLDYVPCCREAFEAAMRAVDDWRHDAPRRPTDELFSLFFAISGRLFSEAKRGRHTVAEVMELYPLEFIAESGLAEGLTLDGRLQLTEVFKQAFRAAWGQTHTSVAYARETLETLQQKGYRLFAASNSFGRLQRSRLERAGFLHYFEATFISMDIGYDKPDIRFFDYVMNAIQCEGVVRPQEVLMVGDSMTTDILGARAAGWDTCFFDRRPDEHTPSDGATYVIRTLPELQEIV